MKDTKYVLLVVACCVIGAGFFAGAGKDYLTSAMGGSPSTTPGPRFYTEVKPMPEEIMYLALFQQIHALRQEDSKYQARGETTTFKETFYKTRLGLSPDKFTAVETAYTDYMARVEPINKRAGEIIKKYRDQFPGGELKKAVPADPSKLGLTYEKPPPAPPELGELQKQKDQVALTAKEKIRQALGQTEFSKFESSLRDYASKVLVPNNLNTGVLPKIEDVEKRRSGEGVKK